MATLVLSAAGSALGGAIGGGVAGLSAAALGRAAGAVAGHLIDQTLLGAGAEPVETGRADRFRVMGAREGGAIPRVWGRMRVPGQVIWASRFLERVDETRTGGKGAPSTTTRRHRYSVSLALALCEGPVERIGRIWADGREIAADELSLRLHPGDEAQRPDPLIEAIEGEGRAPAYRGVAYLVIEDLALEPFGNRVPQIHVETFRAPRRAAEASKALGPPLGDLLRGVALSPGSGEFALATTPVRRVLGPGRFEPENVRTAAGRPDLLVSLDQLEAAAPRCRSVSLVVSWFGDDLRSGFCSVYPAVESRDRVTEPLSWSVSGLTREAARVVSADADGRPSFGGAPSDASVVEAIRALRDRGYRVLFYPFLLMDVPPGSGLPDPYGGDEQAAFPWRGRITLDAAPGRPGSVDGTDEAAAQVAAFFGSALADDFSVSAEAVRYHGPREWSYRRFVLHYAHLCAAAGGVDAFAIGSELRGLTALRDGPGSYPAVRALCMLAEEARAALGPAVRLGYAADWSEYASHRPADGSGDVIFHLDPLWAHPEIDFIGIDNYLPLSDWRDGWEHRDAAAGSIYDLDYLEAGIEGGEHYDWFYASEADRSAQARTPIADTAHGEDWVFRAKDIRNWWRQPHHDRPGGVRNAEPTAWKPMSKPIWFTEIGCPAVDKGANQPNVFVDPKSSESATPWFSSGAEDVEMQRRYLQACLGYWRRSENNPISPVYGGAMIDPDTVHVWTWDARPWPDFPRRVDVWADGDNHRLGHWITGRLDAAPLAEVVAEICADGGVGPVEVDALHGVVEGYWLDTIQTGRQALQPLMLAFGFDAVESGGALRFRPRGGPALTVVEPSDLAIEADEKTGPVWRRDSATDASGAVRIDYLAGRDAYEVSATEARLGAGVPGRVEAVSLPLALSGEAAQAVAERWLAEALTAREEAGFALPPSRLALEPGDVISISGTRQVRIDRVAQTGRRDMVARATDGVLYAGRPAPERRRLPAAPVAPAPLACAILDLPAGPGRRRRGLHAAAFGAPWSGPAGVWRSLDGATWRQVGRVERPTVMGELLDAPYAAEPHRWSRDLGLLVRLWGGGLASVDRARVLDGANCAALETSDGRWEILQFRAAELVDSETWRVSGLLRGQAGTEPLIHAPRTVGSRFVLIDDALAAVDSQPEEIGLSRLWRIGPERFGAVHDAATQIEAAATGAALRPYAPALLRARIDAAGLWLSWARRAADDADGWGALADPAPPAGMRWTVEIRKDGVALRRFETLTCAVLYDAAAQAEDGAGFPIEAAVAEIAPGYGPGPETRILIDE